MKCALKTSVFNIKYLMQKENVRDIRDILKVLYLVLIEEKQSILCYPENVLYSFLTL